MNWYKWSQNDGGCNLGIEDFKSLEKVLMQQTDTLDEDYFQDKFLEWSRCLFRYYDKMRYGIMEPPGGTPRSMYLPDKVFNGIWSGEIKLRHAESMTNLSRWCGAAGIKFINMVLADQQIQQSMDSNKIDVFILKVPGYSEEKLFKFADRESLEQIFNVLNNRKNGNFLTLGYWALFGVMANPNAPAEFQDFITKTVFTYEKTKKNLREEEVTQEKISILNNLMTNPNASSKAMNMFLNGNIIHGNSEFLKTISYQNMSGAAGRIMENLWKSRSNLWNSKGVKSNGLNPNEEILGMISEYIKRIVDQWHASMFDTMRGQSYDYKKMMDIVGWINLHTKNPETIRKNFDTFLKATKTKAPPAQRHTWSEVPILGDGLIHASQPKNETYGLISTFIIKGSSLSEDELQNLMEILMYSHMQKHSNSVVELTGMLDYPIDPSILNTKNFLWMGISKKDLLVSFKECLKKFRFKDFVEKLKKNQLKFPDNKALSMQRSFGVYALRLTVVKSLLNNSEFSE